ncbi:MAG: nuclear transport factor 2 family protein [Candidatus Rokubacteria bacterium]|nr:nuclear transport factor 2 family protein [Candidatus Rokubacteria bacterium]
MSIVDDFTTAFNRQDVGALVACFTPAASYADGFYGEHRGTDELRAMFARMFREGRDYAWRMDTVVQTGDRAAAEWTFRYVVSDAVPRSAGRRVGFRGMSLFELERGKIRAYREYFDVGQACLQLGFAPDAIARVLRRKLDAVTSAARQ